MEKSITMASLFDGIGGFRLAAVRCGVEPVWASEIEPFPILVTKLRFPQMTHMGDITKLNGADLGKRRRGAQQRARSCNGSKTAWGRLSKSPRSVPPN